MRSVLNILDLSVEEIQELKDLATDIIDNPDKYNEVCKNK